MKKLVFILVIVLTSNAIAQAQNKQSYQSLMMSYFEASGIDDEYNNAYDGMLTMIKDAYQTQEVPANVWEKIESNKSNAVAKFKGILASEYRSIFDDKEDLRNLIKFFNSNAGKQLKANPNNMSEEDKIAYSNFKKSNTGTKLFGRMDKINAAKESSSIYWSKELFCQVTNDLKKLGYDSSMPMGNCN